MHVAAVQFDIAWEDKAENHRRVEALLDDADLPAGSFILLPELGDTGFSFDLGAIVDDRSLAWAIDLARGRSCWIQTGYAVRGPDGLGRNCATIVGPGGAIAGTYEKVHPFGFGGEVDHFAGGERLRLCSCGGGVVCPLICYDLRFPELWRQGVRPPDGGPPAELFTIGASWPNTRHAHWRALLQARAIENQAYVVSANRIGRDPHLAYEGGSVIIDPMGVVVAEAGERSAVIRAEVDLDGVREWRRSFPALADIRPGLLGTIAVDRGPADRVAGEKAGENGERRT